MASSLLSDQLMSLVHEVRKLEQLKMAVDNIYAPSSAAPKQRRRRRTAAQMAAAAAKNTGPKRRRVRKPKVATKA